MRFIRSLFKQSYRPSPELESIVTIRTRWTPLTRTKAFLRSHDLKRPDPSRRILATSLNRFGIAAVFVPHVASFPLIFRFLIDQASPDVLSILGAVLLSIAALGLYAALVGYFLAPMTLDKLRGVYAKRWFGQAIVSTVQTDGARLGSLSNVSAIQVLRKAQFGLEVNLVLVSGQRVHLFNTGALSSMANLSRDLDELSDFLQVPVWNDAAPRQPQQSAQASSPALQPA
jgi:hypothetical protein